jgi:hypothetical protein
VPRRLLAPLAVVLVLMLGAGCADDVAPAARVGDVTIGNDAFLDEMEEWVGNPNAVTPELAAAAAPGAFPGELTRQLLTQRVDFELHAQEFESLGLELDQAARDLGIQVLFGDPLQAETALEPFSDDFAASFLDDVARQVAVEEALGEGYTAWRQQAYATTDIEVSPRYGTWNGTIGAIDPPAGPRPAGSADPTAGL